MKCVILGTLVSRSWLAEIYRTPLFPLVNKQIIMPQRKFYRKTYSWWHIKLGMLKSIQYLCSLKKGFLLYFSYSLVAMAISCVASSLFFPPVTWLSEEVPFFCGLKDKQHFLGSHIKMTGVLPLLMRADVMFQACVCFSLQGLSYHWLPALWGFRDIGLRLLPCGRPGAHCSVS